MKLVRHPHVVQLKEVLASRSKIFIVLELVTGGELFDKIVADGRFKEKTARFYFQQLCVGTAYCHLQGVCHRDLKPENLLLDDQGNLKISDFGLSALYEQDADSDRASLLHTTCGTPNYVAPEVLADKGYDGSLADTWSIGVILYVFLAGFLPFDEPTMSALFRKIQKAEFSYPSWFTSEVKDLLNKILTTDPSKRYTIKRIMQHSWWKKDGPYANLSDIETTASGPPPKDAGDIDAIMDDAAEGKPPPAAPKDAVAGNRPVVESVDENDGSQAQKVADEPFPKKVNAFDLINMCSGSAINRMMQNGDDKGNRKTHLYASAKPAKEIMDVIMTRFKELEGFQEQSSYKNDSKLRAVFDFGRGHVHVKVSVKIASKQPNLCLIVFKRARGDLISFEQNVSESIEGLAKELAAEALTDEQAAKAK